MLDDPSKNTEEYMESQAKSLMGLDDESLKQLGEAGKDRRAAEDEAAIAQLRKKHHVS